MMTTFNDTWYIDMYSMPTLRCVEMIQLDWYDLWKNMYTECVMFSERENSLWHFIYLLKWIMALSRDENNYQNWCRDEIRRDSHLNRFDVRLLARSMRHLLEMPWEQCKRTCIVPQRTVPHIQYRVQYTLRSHGRGFFPVSSRAEGVTRTGGRWLWLDI